MKNFLQKYKNYIFPFIIIIGVIVLSLFRLNGTSVAMYNKFLNLDIKNDKNLLLGVPRANRSDQYVGGLPIFSSQNINEETTLNQDIGEGMRMETQNVPTKTFFSIFRPAHFFFYFSHDTALSYSFFWWTEMALMVICVYLLLLEITNKNLFISILGSLIFFLSPFFHWWNQFNNVTWVSLGLFFFLRITKESKPLNIVLYGLGLTYSLISFALILYPPFQIPLGYVAIVIGIAAVCTNWENIKKNVKFILPTIIGTAVITGIVLFLFFFSFKDVIEITANTVYPGARFISAGWGNLSHLFNGFYNILLQKDSNIAPFGNQSESSNFLLLFPPIILWVLYKNIVRYIKKEKIDILGLLLSSILVLFLIFYFCPIPDFFSKITFFFMVPPQRMLIGIGFANFVLLFYILSKNTTYKTDKTTLDTIIATLLSILFGILLFYIGKKLLEISPDLFRYPTFISANTKILLVSIFVSILTFLILRGRERLSLLLLLLYSCVSVCLINPVYRGLDPLIGTDLSQYIQEVSAENDDKWVAYNSLAMAQYALANGASVINGMHTYPQFDIWDKIDTNREYEDIYNRFAHVSVSQKRNDKPIVNLIAADTIEINMDACDVKWKELSVKHIISKGQLDEPCLILQREFRQYDIYIYEIM